MNYPLISEYIEAIRSAEDNFDKLSNLRPVLDDNGNPVMSSGNFAVVFKMKDVNTGRLFAVKCFIKHQEGRRERYAKICEELEFVSSPYILHTRYIERELFVSTSGCDEEVFPVLVMDWVEGLPLDAYLRQHLREAYALQMLAYRFCKMGAWLLSQPFAHGDLKPDNILVRKDGTLVLVDYDGMFVPSMEGEKANEIGSPDFRHPLRTEQNFDEHIDDFSIVSIALSLKALSINPKLWQQHASADRLLFSAADYRDIGQSSVMQSIMGLASDSELSTLLGIFLLSLAKNSLGHVSFRLLLLTEPEEPVIEVLSTEITDEERKNAVADAYGALYTADGLKLISVPLDVRDYKIKEGTKVIGDYVFSEDEWLDQLDFLDFSLSWNQEPPCADLASIIIPDSVISIGKGAFVCCFLLASIKIPDSVTSIGDGAFAYCRSLVSITIPNNVTSIGDHVFRCCDSLTSITIPDSVKSIGDSAFYGCRSLSSIIIPDSVTSIGNRAFWDCSSLSSITIPNSVASIGNRAFWGCSSLSSITIPDSVKHIGVGVMTRCYNLRHILIKSSKYYIQGKLLLTREKEVVSCWSNDFHINLPQGIACIGAFAFSWCKSLASITIPDSVTSIGNSAFSPCESLTSITIPNSVTNIGDSAFSYCRSLASITIPDSVTSIGNSAFSHCESLASITIPDSVTSIGDSAFSHCGSLASITIPDSVTSIGETAFWYCNSLTSITIPDSVTSIGNGSFTGCYSLQEIKISKGIRERLLNMLGSDFDDILVEI